MLERQSVARSVFGKRRIGFAVGNIQAIAAIAQFDRLACHGRGFEGLQGWCGYASTSTGCLGLCQDLEGLFQTDLQQGILSGDRSRFGPVLKERAKATLRGDHRLTIFGVVAQFPWKRKKLDGQIDIDVLRRHSLGQRRVFLLFIVVGSELNIRSKTPLFDIDRLRRNGVESEWLFGLLALVEQLDSKVQCQFIGRHVFGDTRPPFALFDIRPIASDAHDDLVVRARDGQGCIARFERIRTSVPRIDFGGLLGQQGLEPDSPRCSVLFVDIIAKVELLKVRQILAFVAADLVQVIFHVGGKLVVDKRWKMVFHQLNYSKSRPAWDQRIAFFEDIITTQDRVDDRRVSTRAADASLLERLGQRGFGESGRGLGRVRERIEFSKLELFLRLHAGQEFFFFCKLRRRIVASLDIGSQETLELDRCAGGLEDRIGRMDRHDDPQFLRVGHLRCDGSLPDHVKDAELVIAEFIAECLREPEGVARRSDRLVSLLGVLDLGRVGTLRIVKKLRTILGPYKASGRRDGFFGKRRRIGPHVGDIAVFVEALRNTHRVLGGEPKLAVGLLLERAGGKRSLGPLGKRLDLDFRYGEWFAR